MRRSSLIALFLALSIASCVPQPAPAPTGTSAPTAIPTAHAPQIRFALIGGPRDVNVWELFDETGASYADYALRSEYWPRLYHLGAPELTFAPLAADGMPARVTREGDFYTASVSLRRDLKWTDGSRFSAEDVAFTVNTALAFELGYDWRAYYSGEYLERAEAPEPFTIKFVFKKKPNAGIWQYGALQGPIVQKTYWDPGVNEAMALLPDDQSIAEIKKARAYVEKLQLNVDELTAQVASLRLSGQSNRKLEGDLAGSQGELTFAQNSLNKLLDDRAAKMQSARKALYAVDEQGEPTLGTWVPAGKQNGAWVNQANPGFPFAHPDFDRAVYAPYANEAEAVKALENNNVDMILQPGGSFLPPPSMSSIASNINNRASFVVVNPSNTVLADPALRQAFSCIAWVPSRSDSAPLNGFVLQGNDFWRNPDSATPCSDLTGVNIGELRRERIIKILKDAGYSWQNEPTQDAPGSGLTLPNGRPFPAINLLGPSNESGSLQAPEAKDIGEAAAKLGIPIGVEYVNLQDIRYQVLGSKRFDMAILSWRLSLYPGYLCGWFGAGGQFDYGSDSLKSECKALNIESDLEAARRHIFEIQSILGRDLPFIPLDAEVTHDAYRNIRYPFDKLLGGPGGLYGGPSYAIPQQ